VTTNNDATLFQTKRVDPLSMEQNATEAEAVAEIVKRSIEPRTISLGFEEDNGDSGRGVLIVPNGVEVKSIKKLLDEYRKSPERRRGTATVSDLESFTALVNRFKDGDSALFADRSATSPSLLAVLDYHRAGGEGAPRFGDHRVSYPFPLSVEWQAWQKFNGEVLSQAQFAEFIEDRLADAIDPAGALEGASKFSKLLGCTFASPQKLLEVSRGLSLHVDHRVSSHLSLATGETQFVFSESHLDKADQPLKVPGAFLLAIPVFRLGTVYQVPARLRYRHSAGKVTWSYELYRHDAVFEDAIGAACEEAKKATDLPLYGGTPER
jgi:uncharacterized protein YfdQ (DUF2303 family)